MPFSLARRALQNSRSAAIATVGALLISIGLCAAPLQAQTLTTSSATRQPRSLGGSKCDDASGYNKNQKYDAIIVGAGLAGLTAAKELESHHRSILILESNDRIGGRAYVGQVGPQKTPIDYGGAWLHDAPQNPLTNLVDRAKFDRTRSHLDVPFYIGSSEATQPTWNVSKKPTPSLKMPWSRPRSISASWQIGSATPGAFTQSKAPK